MTCACDGLEYGMTEENHKKEKEYYMEQKQNSNTRLGADYARKRIKFSEEPNTLHITARLQDVEYRSFFDFADTYWVRCEESESEMACYLIRNRRSRSEPTQIVCAV